jgi:hypothetical protein
MQTVLAALSAVARAFAALLALQVAAAAVSRRLGNLPVLAALLLGPVALALTLAGSPLRASAIALFWALCVCLIELRSLVYRGYSLRILADLSEHAGQASVESLKTGYGKGLGLRGLLAKRLAGLDRLGLLRFDGERVAGLSRSGTILGGLGRAARGFLRMETVG